MDVDYGAHVTISNTTIDGNGGAGIESYRNVGSEYETPPTVAVTDSTISHNATGVTTHGGDLLINTSTIADNSGSGILAEGGTTYVVDSTIAGTTSADAPTGGIVVQTGSVPAPAVNVTGTIVAAQASGVPDCSGPLTSSDYNLSSDKSCSFSQANDLQSTDPLLGPLADNGGPTRTMLPGAGSPALDAIPAGAATCTSTFPTDQRGDARPAGSGCDIGAVEVQPSVGVSTTTTTAPVATPPTCPPLVIETKTLPDGTVGQPYSMQLRASGGCDTDYTWAVPGGAPDGGFPHAGSQITVPAGPWEQAATTDGQQSVSEAPEPGASISSTPAPHSAGNVAPPGLAVSPAGVLRGTPTKAGTFTFTVSVDDPVLATLVLVVHAPATATSSRPSAPSTAAAPPHNIQVAGRSRTQSPAPTSASHESLASTGAPIGRLMRLASWLLVIGAALTLIGTRRVRAHRRATTDDRDPGLIGNRS